MTSNSRTCIDNILTNFGGDYISQILHSNISDHTAQKLVVSLSTKSKNNFIDKRCFSELNKSKFKNKLSARDWDLVYGLDASQVNG